MGCATCVGRPLHLLSPPPPLRCYFSAAVATPTHLGLAATQPPRHLLRFQTSAFGGNGGGNNNNNNNGWFNNSNDDNNGDNDDDDDDDVYNSYSRIKSAVFIFALFNLRLASALALDGSGESVREVRGGKTTVLVGDRDGDVFVAEGEEREKRLSFCSGWDPESLWLKSREIWVGLMLPEGFPQSVTSDYFDYSLWRAVQGVASQVSGVLATQALLYAVGLGKGAIPVAAAVNWVLKDGIGYLSKIMLSKYGRHFDVHPKGWRLFADLLENAAFGMEMLTPAFPHLFVPIGAVAGAGRSAAALIQAATRSCFYAGFAAQRNFAEVIAKGEAQGMVSKSIGILIGIGLANCIGTSTPLALATFSVVTFIHMYCNLKSYQSIQLRTLNPYRASLVFSEYLLTGQTPPIKEVNDEEPLFPGVPILNVKPTNTVKSPILSSETKTAALEIENRLQMGSKLSDIVKNKEDTIALFSLYMNEGYLLTEHQGKFCVVLKETCSPNDMLRAVFQVNYLYWLEKNAGIESRSVFLDCKRGGRLKISLDYVEREFNHAKLDSESTGWVVDRLIARPLPNRIRPGYSKAPNS